MIDLAQRVGHQTRMQRSQIQSSLGWYFVVGIFLMSILPLLPISSILWKPRTVLNHRTETTPEVQNKVFSTLTKRSDILKKKLRKEENVWLFLSFHLVCLPCIYWWLVESYLIDGNGVALWLFWEFFHTRWKILFSRGGEQVRWDWTHARWDWN